MKKKVILISIDGMRPDGLLSCGNPYVSELEKMGSYTYHGSSVKPSVTLPCHYSMSHSVAPERHGILTNTYVPEVRPVKGIFEVLAGAGKSSAFFYGWEELRDIARPASLKYAVYINSYVDESVDTLLTDEAIERIEKSSPDFVFLYLVDTDHAGHKHGWMSDAYIAKISVAIDNVKRVIDKFLSEYDVIIMADHGGHDRSHGTESPEDMTVPFFYIGEPFEGGRELFGLSLLNIAPTVAKLMDVAPDPEWDGEAIF